MTDTPAIIGKSLKARLAAGEPSLVLRVKMCRTVDIVGIAQAAGFHGLYLDLQHSTMSLDTVAQISTAALYAGMTPLVRVPHLDPSMIGRLLDGGALGIVVPDVTDAAIARRAVELCYLPPKGDRSTGGPIGITGFRPVPATQYADIVNSETMILAQIESAEAVENAPEIAAVDGIDALFIGTNDLTLSLGIPGQFTHEKTKECYAAAIAAAKNAGKHLFVGGILDPDIVRVFVDMGASPCFFPGADQALLYNAAKQTVDAFSDLA